ncbi:MAG: hypothetical protein O7C98_13370 [Planctomycetota bacterium]|nr:hypothetical protein [Planctomycetota bacterium]
MRVRHLSLLALLLLATDAPAVEFTLEEPPKSFRARKLREKATAAWTEAEAVRQRLHDKKAEPVPPEEIAAAVAQLEKVIFFFEKSLRIEWNERANRTQASALRAWFDLRPHLPAPVPPKTDEEKKARAKLLKKAKRQRSGDLRKTIMEWGHDRRYDNMLTRCRRCDGRGVLSAPFGGRPPPCPSCNRRKMHLSRRAVLDARWYIQSPLFREDGRNVSRMDSLLRTARHQPQRLAPFVKSISIQDVEDHDTWAKVVVKEKLQDKPKLKSTTEIQTYRLYRIGRNWYLWNSRADAKVLDLEKIDPEPKPEEG